ncbi:hypothetical protein N7454_007265 [Penicillium verhagenii]|nr:hypothetical protein N7454_007265 [Penicillium verhagenii]
MASAKPNFGVYTPLVVFFEEDESLDLDSTCAHAKRMAESGVSGLVLQGSNGEAPHLDHSERMILVRAVRDHLDHLGYTGLQLIVGCGAPSVRETLVYISEAKACRADFALVLPPAYWVTAMSVSIIEGFFSNVAYQSELPILIYNFPGVTGGIDISSDSIIRLGRSNPNIIGCKLTCGNVGKLQRVSSALAGTQFAAFGGKSDFFLPALISGSNGIIAALANIAPKLHVEVLKYHAEGKLQAAQEIQSKLSHADWALTKVGIAGVKAIISHYFGYGTGRGRRPLGNVTIAAFDREILASIDEVVAMEKVL